MSSSKNARLVTALIAGAIFGVGLGIAGMTRPSKVLAFLDVGGAWDPSLALVMLGAIGVHVVAVAVARRRSSPLLAPKFSWPARTHIDMPLLAGAALFGVGWGLGGFCPGPALTTAASGNLAAIAFVVAMVGGMTIRHLQTRTTKRS